LQTGDLGVRDLVLGQNRHLTNKGKTMQESPAWAWNAARLRRSILGRAALRIVPRGGGPPRELVRLKQPERFTAAFAWSPDSRWVFFARNNGVETELFRILAAGGPFESAGLRRTMILSVSIHPDGKRITFQGGEPNLELWSLDGFLAR
jgi:Tol biopolymer transport system component